MRRVPSSNPNTTIHREADRPAFTRLLLVLLISLFFAGGFVMAARQHVGAIKLGYDTQALMLEREKLKADEKQLRFDREQAMSPGRLSAEAEKLGLQLATVKQLDQKPPDADAQSEDANGQKAPAKKPGAKKPGARQPETKQPKREKR